MSATLVDGVQSLKIEALSRGSLFSVTTGTGNARSSKFIFAAISPEKYGVAVLTRSSCIPRHYALCKLFGSVSQKGLEPGVISVGSAMYLHDNADISASIIKTRPVTGIWMLPSQSHGEVVIRKAEECFANAIEEIIKKEFPDYRQDAIREIIGRFGNSAGKSAALGALKRASAENGKLGNAIEVMEQYWHRFWAIEFSEIAGDPSTQLNGSRWKGFYGDIGIPSPV